MQGRRGLREEKWYKPFPFFRSSSLRFLNSQFKQETCLSYFVYSTGYLCSRNGTEVAVEEVK